MIKTNNHCIISIQMQTICIVGQCLKRCLQIEKMELNGTKNGMKKNWKKMKKKKKNLMKTYDLDSNRGRILEVDLEYSKN